MIYRHLPAGHPQFRALHKGTSKSRVMQPGHRSFPGAPIDDSLFPDQGLAAGEQCPGSLHPKWGADRVSHQPHIEAGLRFGNFRDLPAYRAQFPMRANGRSIIGGRKNPVGRDRNQEPSRKSYKSLLPTTGWAGRFSCNVSRSGLCHITSMPDSLSTNSNTAPPKAGQAVTRMQSFSRTSKSLPLSLIQLAFGCALL